MAKRSQLASSTVAKPKIFNLQWYTTEKTSKSSHLMLESGNVWYFYLTVSVLCLIYRITLTIREAVQQMMVAIFENRHAEPLSDSPLIAKVKASKRSQPVFNLLFHTLHIHRYDDSLVVPIVENTPEEKDLKDRMARAMEEYPDSCAVLVRRHGVYVWGESWEKAKTMSAFTSQHY